MARLNHGRLILMGSGETSGRLVAAHRLGVEAAGARKVLVLDTPHGFQENAHLLSRKLTGFFRASLSVDASVASYRSVRDGEVACERMLAAVRRARYVFAGPRSPGYALGVWKGTGLAGALRDILAGGVTITLASVAALTAGVKTLPVYEIYKVGAAPAWLVGMDLTSHLGPETVVIPHWDNTEGQGFATARCYMGRRGFGVLRSMLPEGVGVVGVDEDTAAVIDFGKGELSVLGVGDVTLSGDRDTRLGAGEAIDLPAAFGLLGTGPSRPSAEPPEPVTDLAGALDSRSAEAIARTLLALESQAADGVEAARRSLRTVFLDLWEPAASGLVPLAERVGGYVELLVQTRSRLGDLKRWEEGNLIRSGLESLGVTLRDTRSGTVWTLVS